MFIVWILKYRNWKAGINGTNKKFVTVSQSWYWFKETIKSWLFQKKKKDVEYENQWTFYVCDVYVYWLVSIFSMFE